MNQGALRAVANAGVCAHQSIPRCAHCGERARLTTSKAVYPHRPDLWGRLMWECRPCGAYVGCHRPSQKHTAGRADVALGTPANATLRAMRSRVHARFDPIWKYGDMKRNSAYRWLARAMGLSSAECHIGRFSEAQCREALRHLDDKLGDPFGGAFDDLVDS